MELSPDKVSPAKEEFKAVWMEFDTASLKSDEDSSLLLSLKHVLHVISHLSLKTSTYFAHVKIQYRILQKYKVKFQLHHAVEKERS